MRGEESNTETKNMFRQIALLWGPATVLAFTALAISYKKLQFAELIVPIELISIGIMHFVINMSDTFEEKNYQFRQYNFLIVYASYWVLCLFLTASWLIGFLFRLPAIFFSVGIGFFYRIKAGD